MTWMRCIGGPMHDQWYDVPTDRHEWVIPIPTKPPVAWADGPLSPITEMPFDREVYTVEKLVWPGFRFPITVAVARSVEVHDLPCESWPNPLVYATCRCVDAGPYGKRADLIRSACHLDHCPLHSRPGYSTRDVHGAMFHIRWMMANAARADWLDWLETQRDSGPEPAPDDITLREIGSEPSPNRAHTP
jgi:hypothetical protein